MRWRFYAYSLFYILMVYWKDSSRMLGRICTGCHSQNGLDLISFKRFTKWIQSNGILVQLEKPLVSSSFSLISIDEVNGRFSMHPLVHAWAGDWMDRTERKNSQNLAASTLAMSMTMDSRTSDYPCTRTLSSTSCWILWLDLAVERYFP